MAALGSVILVDDDPNVLAGYARLLRNRFSLDTATSGEEGLRIMAERGPYAVVVSDIRMPAMSGIEFLRQVWDLYPDTVRVLLTGYADLETATAAINTVGAFRFLTKPCSADELAQTLLSGIEHYRLFASERAVLSLFGDLPAEKGVIQQFLQDQRLETMGRLAGAVAHDFNNLLTAIGGHASFALDEIPVASPARADIEQIIVTTNRAASLTHQLLAFSHGQAIELKHLNLNDIILNASKLIRRLVGEHIELVVDLCQAPLQARVDPGQIEQVLMNLVVNACDAMPAGGKLAIRTAKLAPLLTSVPALADSEPTGRILLSVSDTGIGMTADVKMRVFEPFFSTKDPAKGTGLGLATVYGIVKQHHGTIEVDSQPGAGTTFRVLLPVVEAPSPRNAGEPQGQPELAKGTGTIIVAEDDDLVRRVVTLTLRRQGYTVMEAGNGVEAMDLARACAEPVSLLVTDMVMPRMGGSDLVEAFLGIHPKAKVLLVSGYSDQLDTPEAEFDARLASLQKPFTTAALLRKVQQLLEGKQ